MVESQVSRDLMNAATLLRHMGWCQGEWENEFGCHCVIGAIEEVANASEAADAAATALRAFLGRSSAASWNDAPGRTADEVISALEAAARGDGNG